MKIEREPSAIALGLGAVLLWAAWALMPDAATNDAAHILTAVTSARGSVHASATLQLAGAALIVAGLAAEAGEGRRARAGAVAMLVGCAGMAADAVYHQLAYEMTAPGVARDAVLPVMERMQTEALRPLIPLLLLFPLGAVVLGAQRRRRGVGSPWTARLLIAPALIVPFGVAGRAALGLPKRFVALTVLGAICAGLLGVAVDRLREKEAHRV
jgi:hypothetical protein